MIQKIPTWMYVAALFILLFITLGLPIADWGGYALLAIASIASCVGHIAQERWRWAVALIACMTSLATRLIVPMHSLEEGHALFNPSINKKNPLIQALPAEVFDKGRQLMAQHQPNWTLEPSKRIWAFAADSLWQTSSLSRQRYELDFDDRWDLRIGTLNDERANLYDAQTGAYGLYIPLVFRFDFPLKTLKIQPSNTLGRLCWRGLVFWPQNGDDSRLSPITYQETTCQDFSTAIANLGQPPQQDTLTLYALDMDGVPPLAMRLETTWWRDYGARIARAVGWLAGAIILAALVHMRAGALIAGLIASILMINYLVKDQKKWSRPSGLSVMAYMERGNDGLTHFGKGRQILASLVEGDIDNFLRGEADIFYFMPGMRYAHAAMMIIFGDSLLGYFLLILLIPFLLYKIICRILPRLWAVFFFWIYMITPILEAFGLTHFYYVKLAARGFGGALAWVALYGAVVILLPRMGRVMMPSSTSWLGAGLLLALATACRPNIVPLTAGLALGFAWLSVSTSAVRSRHWSAAVCLLLGFGTVGLVTAHNWFYGHALVFLTSSASNPVNLTTPPSAWLEALITLLQGSSEATHRWARIGQHVAIWIEPYEIWFILSYAILWMAALAPKRPGSIRVLAISLLLAHMVFLFYPGYPRYNYGIWALTLMVTFYECRFHLLAWLRMRYQDQARSLDIQALWAYPWLSHIKRGIRTLSPA